MEHVLLDQLSEETTSYEIVGEIITATYKGVTDIFDFTDLPDGLLESIETTLEVQPIISAIKTNGVMRIELLNFVTLGGDI